MRVCPYCHLLLADADSNRPHDGTETGPARVPALPAALEPKFKDLQPFAQGQTGSLALATQVQGNVRGLLKVIPLEGFEGSERVRLKRELRKQTKLAHEGLPRILDGGELGKELWLFREFVEGESLAQRIRRLGRLEVGDALLVIAQVASALDELQRNGLLHRDVKPGHVILQSTPNGMPIARLIDAGVAARLPSGSVFDLIGTPAYISPEQVAGKLISFRSDLYALGCMLFEMLSGAPPFGGADVKAVLEAHKSAPVPDLPSDVELPSQALGLLRALLAKEPRQRPFSAQQVRRTLEPLLPPGAPLPVLHARAPSSAGGISVPPAEAAPRKPRTARPAPPPPVARGSAPNAPPKDVAAEGPNTIQLAPDEFEEIDPSAVPAPSTIQLAPDEFEEIDPSAVPAPSTIHLAPDELEELDPSAERGPSTINLGPDDIEALEVREQAAALAAQAQAEAPADEPAAPAAVEPAREPARSEAQAAPPEAAPEPAPAHGAPAAEPEPQPEPQPASATPAAAGERTSSTGPNRRTVDFDVESLFEDEVPEPAITGVPTSLQEAAPTQIYRPDAPVVRSAAAVRERVAGDPEGTVVVARPGARPKRPAWMWAAAGAAVLVLAIVLAFSGDDEESGTAAAAADPQAAGTAEPSASGARPTASAAQGGAQRAEPSAAERGAPAQPSAAEQPHAEAQAGQAQPAPDEPAPAAEPEPAQAQAQAAAQPAPAAEPAAAPSAAASEEPRKPAATLSAAAASAKLGPSAGSKLVPPRASRAERLAKAAEYKQQGREHYQAGRYREAAAAYQNATELDPSDAGAFAGLAASRLASGDANAAIAAYSRAVRLQPSSSGFHAALGRAYLASGDRPRARAAYQKALELNPNNGAAQAALEQLR